MTQFSNKLTKKHTVNFIMTQFSNKFLELWWNF